MTKPKAIVIGAGFTGVATAHDLALRGVDVTVVERGPLANGTSGRTHGLLHSGSRYAVNDKESAEECIQENMILRKIVPEAIEPNGGLFVGINESDLAYGEAFIEGNEACNIPIRELTKKEALELEPNLNPNLLAAFWVPDGTFDPLRLAMAFAATAQSNGAKFYLYTEVLELIQDGQGNVKGVRVLDRMTDKRTELYADVVVNATGAWAGQIAENVGAQVPVKPTPGVMVAYGKRLTHRVVNRLNKPGDGDIILPQRRMMVVGTTSYEVEDLDYVPVIEEQVDLMLTRGSELIPGLKEAPQRGAYTATRPLIGAGSSGRSIARTFKFFDHKESDGVDGLVTITGGKATTLRLMGEKTADVVVKKLGMDTPGRTAEVRLISYRYFVENQGRP
ncbi:MAG: FAD-dependent oxidoreductase [Chloroflexi bacterium]|jgi:glycerol-3-phosphate dehydrogenase|nr:FAD-dependent oxidoreductase [Chloroflexota bacterium]